MNVFNPLNAELKPICHLLTLLGAHHILHVSGLRVNNVILARNRQLPDDDRMIELRRSIFKSFNINNLSVCIGWCADQVTLRSARCDDKDEKHVPMFLACLPVFVTFAGSFSF